MAGVCKVSILIVVVVMLSSFSEIHGDPDMLQDICVADLTSAVRMNGFACRASNITSDDFFFAGIVNPGNTTNAVGSIVTGANVQRIPGLNTLGVSMARIDFAPGGVNPPHTHPRATEIVYVLYGELYVGFVTTANQLYSKIIKKGEVFVFPKGLVHFQQNNGRKAAAVISSFNSQLAGTQVLGNSLFAANPTVPNTLLAKSFRIQVADIQGTKDLFAAFP